jgi:hypothetical protein
MTRIAKSGITYNRFHNAAMCSPSRAALLTGRNHHRSGFGQIAELANDWEGYTGHWPATTASVVEVETRIAAPRGAADVVIRLGGKEIARGRVPCTATLAFTANDAFDVGMDSYFPVSEAYFDRKPFRFNGRLEKVQVKYLQ